jgi:hypothetical protein
MIQEVHEWQLIRALPIFFEVGERAYIYHLQCVFVWESVVELEGQVELHALQHLSSMLLYMLKWQQVEQEELFHSEI